MADVFQSYSWRSEEAGHILAGHLGDDGVPHWHWNRLAAAMEIQTKDSLMLSRNKDKFHAELQAAEVPVQQFHYNQKGADDVHRAGHVLESRALLVIVAALVGYKKYSPKTKTTGLLLLAELVRQAASLPVAQAEQLRISFNMQVPSTVIFCCLKFVFLFEVCFCQTALRCMMGWSSQ